MPYGVPAFVTATPTNRIVGQSSAEGNTGDNVFFVGAAAGDNNTGANVIGIGQNAAENNTGADVTALGRLAALNNTVNTVTAIGDSAARDNTGPGAIAVGTSALRSNTGVNSIGLGLLAGQDNNSPELIAIGVGAANAGILAGDVTNLIAIGSDAAGATAQTNVDGNIIHIGQDAGALTPGGANHRWITIIGGQSIATHAAVFGFQSLTTLGAETGMSVTDNATDCVIIGARACHAATTFGNNHTAVGSQAMFSQGAGSGNSAFGKDALRGVTTGVDNFAAGVDAGDGIGGGDQNVLIGTAAQQNAVDSNVSIGFQTGIGNTSSQNVFIGAEMAAPTGARNVILGHGAHISATWVQNSDVFAVETRDGIGNPTQGALYAQLDNGNVAVGMTVDGNGDPIDRNFSGTNVLKVLSGTAPSVNPVGGGFLYVTAGALNYRGSGGTITPLAAA